MGLRPKANKVSLKYEHSTHFHFRFEGILLYSAYNRAGWMLRKLGSKLCEAEEKLMIRFLFASLLFSPNAIDSDQLSAQPTLTFSEIEFRQNVLLDL